MVVLGVGLAPAVSSTVAGTVPAFAGGGAGITVTATSEGQSGQHRMPSMSGAPGKPGASIVGQVPPWLLGGMPGMPGVPASLPPGQNQPWPAGSQHQVHISVAENTGESDLQNMTVSLTGQTRPVTVICPPGTNGTLVLEPNQVLECTAEITAQPGYQHLVAHATANIPGGGHVNRETPFDYWGSPPPVRPLVTERHPHEEYEGSPPPVPPLLHGEHPREEEWGEGIPSEERHHRHAQRPPAGQPYPEGQSPITVITPPVAGELPIPLGGEAPAPAGGQVPTPMPVGGMPPMPAGGQVPMPAGGQAPVPAGGQAPMPAGGELSGPSGGEAPMPAGGETSMPPFAFGHHHGHGHHHHRGLAHTGMSAPLLATMAAGGLALIAGGFMLIRRVARR